MGLPSGLPPDIGIHIFNKHCPKCDTAMVMSLFYKKNETLWLCFACGYIEKNEELTEKMNQYNRERGD